MGLETGQPIEVYVELAGKEKYHSSLRGRDEENQHPISAITNLEDNLDSLQERININRDNISELAQNVNNRFYNFEVSLDELESTVNTVSDSIDTKIDAAKEEIEEETASKITEVRNFVTEQISHIDLEAYYTKDETEERLEGVFHYKGQVPDFESLPYIHNEKGDVYNVSKTGANYVWTGYAWDNLSPTICLKGYATKDYVDGTLEASIRLLQNHLQVHYYDKEEIDAKLDSIIHFDPTLLDCMFVFKGAVATVNRLPQENNRVGDVYVVTQDNSKWFWAGVSWEKLADDLIDKIYTKEEIDVLLAQKADKDSVYTKTEINELLETQNTNLTNLIQSEINTVNETIETLSTKHDSDILGIERELDDLRGHYSDLNENINTIQTELDTVSDKVDQITEQTVTRDEFDALDADVQVINEQVNAIKDNIDEINEQRVWHEIE